ncbi:MAG: hypothetical protein JSW58_15870 [Candidatus Latescibacterota bacterium]|nr:MAG: hypothetical protein JSW58_15870 [Candidatus Latescibacterota bacterium]
MKTRFSPILWILIIALAGQGALPGLVVCFEAAGQVRVEIVADKCCYGDTKSSGKTSGFLLETSPKSKQDNSCGPCLDTPISPVPVTKPSRNGDIIVHAFPNTTLVFDPATIETGSYSAAELVTTDAALIPIKTTILLI